MTNQINFPKELTDIDGFNEFIGLLETPDIIFDAMYPALKNSFEEQFKDSHIKKLVKELQQGTNFESFKKETSELITELKKAEDVSENKKEFLLSFFNIFLDQNYDAEVFIQLSDENIKIPVYANLTDAGADISANEDIIIPAQSFGTLIHTGISVAIPNGWLISVRPRSGLSKKTTLRISNAPGTIDAGYRDEIGILIDNIGTEPITINKGDRIAQLILEKSYQIKWNKVNSVKEIGEDRGGGFGSTGTK